MSLILLIHLPKSPTCELNYIYIFTYLPLFFFGCDFHKHYLLRFSLLPENLETADVVNLAYARTLQKHHTFLQRQVQLKDGNNWAWLRRYILDEMGWRWWSVWKGEGNFEDLLISDELWLFWKIDRFQDVAKNIYNVNSSRDDYSGFRFWLSRV